MHPHRLAHRLAQVGAAARPRRGGAAGASTRRHEADAGHDAPHRGELVVGARGEGLVAEDLDVGCDEAESGLAVVLAVAAGFGGGDLDDRLRVGRGWQRRLPRLRKCLVLVEEEASEHAVVHPDLVAVG